MNSEALQVAKVYRQLLKAVKNHIGKGEKKKHFVDYVAQKFRDKSILSKPHSVRQEIKLARDYTFLLNSVHHQKAIILHSHYSLADNHLNFCFWLLKLFLFFRSFFAMICLDFETTIPKKLITKIRNS